jgi:predicted Ser/Thr protein kinase
MVAPNSVVGNRYRVVRPLGGGGMKQVYLAEDRHLANRLCAIAEMTESFTDLDEKKAATDAFNREAEVLAHLNHDRIVRIYDRLSDGSRHYLVMEYVEGETLEDKLEAAPNKQLDQTLVIGYALEILDALAYLHGRVPPVVYRDLKPANVVVTPEGRVKLIDFGIARLFVPKKTATMIGTQGYAPPEQYEGKAEPRSDLYALAVVMLQLLTGWDPTLHPPFMFRPLRTLRPDVDPVLEALMSEALAMDASQRIGSAVDFRRRLENIKSPSGSLGIAPEAPTATTPLMHDHSSQAPTVTGLVASKRCPRCSRDIPAGAVVCPYCSAQLQVASSPNTAMKVIAGLFGGLLLAIIGTPLVTTTFAASANGSGVAAVAFLGFWTLGFVIALAPTSAPKAWRHLLLTSAVLSFLLPVSGIIYTGSFMATHVDTSAEHAGAQAAGAAIGGLLVTGILGFVGLFLGVALLVIGLLVGRDRQIVYVEAPGSSGGRFDDSQATNASRHLVVPTESSWSWDFTAGGKVRPAAFLAALVVIGVVIAVETANLPTSKTNDSSGDSRVSASAVSPTSAAAIPVRPVPGGWHVDEERSEMDGSPTVMLGLDSNDRVQGWLESVRPTLVIRCLEHKTSVYVVTGMGAQPVAGEYDQHPVELRFNEGKPITQWWRQSTDSKALFASSPIVLSRRLTKSNRLRFRFTPFNASPAIASFDLRGLDRLLPKVANACGWR